MRKFIRHITRLCLYSLALSLAACASDNIPEEILSQESEVKDQEVTLALQVCIDNASGSNVTRAGNGFEFVGADDVYEMMHTLRVIIVRPDNTVEHNRMIQLKSYNKEGEEIPAAVNAADLKELEFKVSTSQGKPNSTSEYNIEEKRIYLIANEKTITETPTSSDNLLNAAIKEIKDFLNVNPGDKLDPKEVSNFVIYNNTWTQPSINDPFYAEPYIDNGSDEKKYIPMTESFKVDVGADTTTGETTYTQKVSLFVTRALVKFQFNVEANGVSFRIKELRFNNLMQREYLFPNETKYYQVDDDIQNRVITEFKAPSPSDFNHIGPYIFDLDKLNIGAVVPGQADPEAEIPETFRDLKSEYHPSLYFCETDNDVTDEAHNRIYTLSMTAEIDMGDGTIEEVTFAPQQFKNLPYSLPRNTIVRVSITISNNHELSCTATLLPYTGVWLNPVFGL